MSPIAEQVRQALITRGLETPMVGNSLPPSQKREAIAGHVRGILTTLGLDLADDSLCETPERMAKLYVDELFAGLDYGQFPKISQIENKMGVSEMVRVQDISVISTCEHHLITIDGRAKVAYIPGDKVLGLSKINRIVRFFAQRPQVQERLTQQILVALQTILGTEDVAVHMAATHYCVKARGVRDAESFTETQALAGAFKRDPGLRAEFLR
ncbi:GTP cyclohydrolase I FolE [Simiduia agarivorans]|uniref:GTP cyclohydrolase 1 n=1 Tax=Simiduia agarivorans (strain DSM 21679 / JCM 13881 / BCRC 17597 / SA1) TaxID=1117647 RepID=K4L147_SIMAS|nr:GTP cyclohydrolase I FolE [Simiduia agarivorans]AFU99897.2 GTP cyclohydrolase I type 1 [Simiduia agarivorans SA1 = DSM 21679]